jgi:hypothetical protein
MVRFMGYYRGVPPLKLGVCRQSQSLSLSLSLSLSHTHTHTHTHTQMVTEDVTCLWGLSSSSKQSDQFFSRGFFVSLGLKQFNLNWIYSQSPSHIRQQFNTFLEIVTNESLEGSRGWEWRLGKRSCLRDLRMGGRVVEPKSTEKSLNVRFPWLPQSQLLGRLKQEDPLSPVVRPALARWWDPISERTEASLEDIT